MKIQIKMILISFILFSIFQLFLKGIDQYNIISFIFGGLEYAIYSEIVENMKKKELMKNLEQIEKDLKYFNIFQDENKDA